MNSEELRTLRTKHNLTQGQLADAIGVKQSKVSEWENGRYKTISPVYQRVLKEYFEKLTQGEE